MSGFAGVVSLDGAPPDVGLLDRMAQTLAFRGPDGTHITVKPGAGFCFTFLRTGPAPQCPSQPCSLDGRIWLFGDVRLDGRNDLRRKLEQHGDEFDRDVTDEELVLRAWRRWREDSLSFLIGDYSFTLWDAEARDLWCARDLMGPRPFFYARAGNRLYFSNTLKTIRCAHDISSALDHHFIGDFLLQGSCSYPDRTAFRSISRLPAGHVLYFSNAGHVVRRFACLPIEEPLWFRRDEEYVEQFRALFEQAVLDRLPRGSAGIFMSGGLDSTSVATVAVHSARKNGLPLNLRAFTVHCRPLFDDQEGRLAAHVAEHLSIPIEIWSQSSCLPFEGWDEKQVVTPGPSQEPYLPSSLEQSRCVSLQSPVVFTGYGGDGILTGQAWPYLVYLARRLRLAEIAMTFGAYFVRNGRIPPLRGGFRSRLNRFRSDPMAEYPRWFSPRFESEMRLRERWGELMRSSEKSHPLYPDAHSWLNDGYWSEILEREDAEWMNVPLESRAPFLDRRLINFLLRVPPVPLCIDKELLRRAIVGMLPDEVRNRRKVPLAGDPLLIQLRSGKWSPLPLPQPMTAVASFVDWERLPPILANSSGDSLSRNLRPVLLNHWLKGIENVEGIQYIRKETPNGA